MPVYRATGKTLQLPDRSEEWEGEFTFIQAADCQLGMEWAMIESGGFGSGNDAWKEYYHRATWEHEIRNLKFEKKFRIDGFSEDRE